MKISQARATNCREMEAAGSRLLLEIGDDALGLARAVVLGRLGALAAGARRSGSNRGEPAALGHTGSAAERLPYAIARRLLKLRKQTEYAGMLRSGRGLGAVPTCGTLRTDCFH